MIKRKILILFFLIILTLFIPIVNVSAKTIKDYRKELASLKDEKKQSEANQAEIEKKIAAANKEINSLGKEIQQAQDDQIKTKAEIIKLEEQIVSKRAQMKELIVFFQVSDSENFYLKYLFGAENFTDFIYRFSVIEQITARTGELVDEMNVLIKENELKIIELEALEKKSKELYAQVQKKLADLGKERAHFLEEALDYDSQIRAVQKKIDYYVDQGCSETIQLNQCLTQIPFDFGFNIPLKKGYVSDEYGMRYSPISGAWSMHNGIDLAGNAEGTSVYAPAAGKVVDITKKYYCGGNMIVMNHIVNGKNYTTRYLHLLEIKVKEGDIVQKGEVIGTVGGGAKTSSYERCSTGAHLHFEMATGHYYGSGEGSYSSYSTYVQRAFNPREMVYFPKYGVRW